LKLFVGENDFTKLLYFYQLTNSIVLSYPVSDIVEILVIDNDNPQGNAILSGASAKEMVKYHIQGLAIVNKPQNLPAECLVVTITI
jgi:hypothetical protein